MTDARDEEAVACFGTVAARLQRLFCRFPKSRSLSETLQTPQKFHGKAWLVRGRSTPLQLGVRGFLDLCLVAFLVKKSCGILQATWYLMLSTAPSLDSPDSAGIKAQVLPPCLIDQKDILSLIQRPCIGCGFKPGSELSPRGHINQGL
jgi:hypothetical protein